MQMLVEFSPYLIVAAMIATVLILFTGLFGFARGKDGGKSNKDGGQRANKIMRWRVGMQLIAILLFVIFAYFIRGQG